MNIVILMLFIIEGSILGILAFVLRYKYSEYPDFRVGYHVESATESKENWDYTNKAAGNICGIFAMAFFIISVLMYCLKVSVGIAIVVLLVLSLIMAGSVLLIPIHFLNRKNHL